MQQKITREPYLGTAYTDEFAPVALANARDRWPGLTMIPHHNGRGTLVLAYDAGKLSGWVQDELMDFNGEAWWRADVATLRSHRSDALTCVTIDCGPLYRWETVMVQHIAAMEVMATEAALHAMGAPA